MNLGTAASGAGADTDGKPHTEFLDVLVSDGADFIWVGDTGTAPWTLTATDDDTTIRVQFLRQGAVVAGTATDGPRVPWLVRAGAAIRLQARNSDGAWVCALIVARPVVSDTDAATEANYLQDTTTYVGSAPTLPAGAVAIALTGNAANDFTGRRISAWLGGTWYDQGDSGAADLGHCDPVGVAVATNSAKFWYPVSGNRWIIATTEATLDASNVDEGKDFTRTLND